MELSISERVFRASVPEEVPWSLPVRFHVFGGVPKCHLAFDLNAAAATDGKIVGLRAQKGGLW